MACPKRNFRAIESAIKSQESKKLKWVSKDEEISEEEHQERIKKLKEAGLIK